MSNSQWLKNGIFYHMAISQGNPTCSLYTQTPLSAGSNPKHTQKKVIWQMSMFDFVEFRKLKYVHHTIDTYTGFQWETALCSEKADLVITHLLEVLAIIGIIAPIKTQFSRVCL